MARVVAFVLTIDRRLAETGWADAHVDLPREGQGASETGVDADEVLALAITAGFQRVDESTVVPVGGMSMPTASPLASAGLLYVGTGSQGDANRTRLPLQTEDCRMNQQSKSALGNRRSVNRQSAVANRQ